MAKPPVPHPNKPPRVVRAARVLFFVNAAIWLVLGSLNLLRLAAQPDTQWIANIVIALLMFGNAAALLISGIGIGIQKRLFFYFGILVLAANILLTFTDQFGIFDLVTLLIDLALLAILILSRSNYRSPRPEIAGGLE